MTVGECSSDIFYRSEIAVNSSITEVFSLIIECTWLLIINCVCWLWGLTFLVFLFFILVKILLHIFGGCFILVLTCKLENINFFNLGSLIFMLSMLKLIRDITHCRRNHQKAVSLLLNMNILESLYPYIYSLKFST